MFITKDIQLFFIRSLEKINEIVDKILKDFFDQKINNLFYGPSDKNRIAILGAFDTWPYMDLVCRIISHANYIAVSSRYIYHKFKDNIIKFPITKINQFVSTDLSMSRLIEKIIGNCLLAIINYSVSAAHYIETDWCWKVKDLDYIGIAYVRDIFKTKNCENLKIYALPDNLNYYSMCEAIKRKNPNWNAWDCIDENEFCPFKQQDISKNILEYYFHKDKNLKLIACSNLEILPQIIKNELDSKVEELNDFHSNEFNKYFNNFNAEGEIIDILLINKGLEFLTFLKVCSILFENLFANINSKLLDIFEIIRNIINVSPSTKKESILKFHLETMEKEYAEEIKIIRGIFTGEDNELLDIISGLYDLKAWISQNFGTFIIKFLIEKGYIIELNAFWELTSKTNNLLNSIGINDKIERYLETAINR